MCHKVSLQVVFDGCQTSRHALEVLSSFTTDEENIHRAAGDMDVGPGVKIPMSR